MKELLEKKNIAKAKKPKFVRKDSNKKRFKNKWRKPRGLHNKRRLKKAGHQKNPSIGYKSPVKVRYLHKSGVSLWKVNNFKDLEDFKNEDQAAIISSKIGMKLKIKILEECQKKKIKVFNVKDIQKFIDESNKKLEERKKSKKKKVEKKQKTKEEAKKKAEEKKEDGKETREETREKVMKSKPETQKQPKQIAAPKKDQTKAKAGHLASSVPGSKQ